MKQSTQLNDFRSQNEAIPDNLLTVVQLILTGSSNTSVRYHESLTIRQLVMTNSLMKKNTSNQLGKKRYAQKK